MPGPGLAMPGHGDPMPGHGESMPGLGFPCAAGEVAYIAQNGVDLIQFRDIGGFN